MSETTRPRAGIIRRAVHGFTEILALASVSLIVVILAAIVADVVRRSATGKSVPGVVEWSEVAMVMIVFLGLGYAERRRAHVSMTLFVRLLPPRVGAVINALGLLLVAAVVAWMVYVTADRAMASYEASEIRFGLIRVPVWPARIAIAVGLLAYLLELAFRLLDTIRDAVANRQPAAIAEDDIDKPAGALL